jgi:tetratricopeptide (TPR) repeat protein
MRQALKIALDHDLVHEALRAYNNLLVLMDAADRPEETFVLLEEGLGLARRRGDRFWELRMAAGLVEEHRWRGDVDEALTLLDSLAIPDGTNDAGLAAVVLSAVRTWLEHGNVARAQAKLDRLAGSLDERDIQQRGVELWRQSLAAEVAGRLDEAGALLVEVTHQLVETRSSASMAESLRDLADLALRDRRHEHALAAAAAVEALPPSARTRAIASQLHRLQANAAAAEGDHETAAERFALALAAARNLGLALWLAPVLRDYGAWLAAAGRTDEAAPLLAQARELFERMGAVVWLEWLDALPSTALEGSAAGA